MLSSDRTKTNRTIAIVLGGLAFLYALAQAWTLHFTHDESISFLIFNGYEGWRTNPNNHFLNTALMQVSQTLFGSSELALRIPNLLAALVFYYYLFQLFKEYKPLVFAAGFALLLFNPLIDDFFPLARGYGLGMAAITGSLYYLQQWRKLNSAKHLHLSIFFAALTLLANLSNLNFVLALIAVLVLVFLFARNEFNFFRDLKGGWTLVLLSAAALAFAVYWLLFFKKHGQLYYGAKSPIEAVQSFIYRSTAFKGKLIYLSILVPGLIIGAAAFFKPNFNYKVVAAILLLALTAIAAEVWLFEIPFPKARTGLYLLLLFLILTTVALNHLPKSVAQVLSVLLIVFTAINFYKTVSIDSTFEDGPGKNNKEAFKLIDQYQVKNVGISWTLEPSFNYYRISGNRNIEALARAGVGAKAYDAYYGYQKEIDPIVAKDPQVEMVKRFDDSKTAFAIRNK